MAQEGTSLSEIVDTIRRRWLLIALVALSLVVGATYYAERQPLQYEASAIVAVTPRQDASADLVRVAAPRYASYITAAATIYKVAPRLREDSSSLQQRVNATIVPDTGNITITVRHTDPRRAQNAANELAAQARRASTPDRLVVVETVAPAVLPTRPAGPPRRLIEASALAVGLLLGVGLAALVDATRRRPAMPEVPSPSRGAGQLTTALTSPRRRLRQHPPSPGTDPHQLGGHPVLCDLPLSPSLRTSVNDALADPPVDKAVQELTANLARLLGGRLRGTVVVTSPSLHQGNTTVARLLAAALRRSKARVLRADGYREHSELLRARKDQEKDRPAPSGNEKYDESGLNWVKDLWALENGKWALPSGRGPVAVTLIEDREEEILADSQEMFDVIVVDGPPLLDENGESRTPASEVLIPLADAVLLVVSPTSTVDSLYRSIEALRDARGPVGVVLNRVKEATGTGGSSKVHRLRGPAVQGQGG